MLPHVRFKLAGASAISQPLSRGWTCGIRHIRSALSSRAQRMMGTDGRMITGVPSSLCSAFLKLKKKNYAAWKTYRSKLSHVHYDMETRLSRQYCKIDDTIPSRLVNGKYFGLNSTSAHIKREILYTAFAAYSLFIHLFLRLQMFATVPAAFHCLIFFNGQVSSYLAPGFMDKGCCTNGASPLVNCCL